MPTAATFVPVLGDFSLAAGLFVAPFVLQSGDNTDVPRDGAAALQGGWRPGVMKTIFELRTPDATANADGSFTLIVPLPRPLDPTVAEAATGQNEFWPLVTVVPTVAQGHVQGLRATIATINEAANTAQITLAVAVPAAQPASWLVGVDFSHTATS